MNFHFWVSYPFTLIRIFTLVCQYFFYFHYCQFNYKIEFTCWQKKNLFLLSKISHLKICYYYNIYIYIYPRNLTHLVKLSITTVTSRARINNHINEVRHNGTVSVCFRSHRKEERSDSSPYFSSSGEARTRPQTLPRRRSRAGGGFPARAPASPQRPLFCFRSPRRNRKEPRTHFCFALCVKVRDRS